MRATAKINPFNREAFLKQIDAMPPMLPVKPKRPLAELYTAFLNSPNFSSWIHARTQDANRECQNNYWTALASADIAEFCARNFAAKQDVEVVELMIRLREELV
jgi:hypothetical protein